MNTQTGNSVVDGSDRILYSQEWRCNNCGSRQDPVDRYKCEANDCQCHENDIFGYLVDCEEHYLDRISWLERILYRLKSKAKKIEAIRADCPECKPAVMCDNCGHLERG